MLPMIQRASRSLRLRGVRSASRQMSASRRSSSRSARHSESETLDLRQLIVQSALAHGAPSPASHWFSRENPYRRWSTCAAMDPPLIAEDAAEAESLSSERSMPASPRLRMEVLTLGSVEPYTNSDRSVGRTSVRSLVFIQKVCHIE